MRNGLFVLLVILFGCRSGPILIEHLPRETEVPGYSLSGTPVLFHEGDIRKENPLFAECGAKEMSRAEYLSLSGGKNIMAYVLSFSSALDAFGLFSRERGFGSQSVDPAEHFSSKGLFLWKGKFCVILLCETAEIQKDDLMSFRNVILKNLENDASSESLPGEAFILTDAGSGKMGLRDCAYYRSGHELLPDAGRIFVRRKKLFDSEKLVFFTKKGSSQEAMKIFGKILKSGKPGFTLSKEKSVQFAFAKLQEKLVFVTVCGRFIAGLLDAESIDEGNRLIYHISTLLEKEGESCRISHQEGIPGE